MMQGWEPSPPTNVGWICWLFTLHQEVFSGHSCFPSPQKPTFHLICVNNTISVYSVPNYMCSRARRTRHLKKVPFLSYTLWNHVQLNISCTWSRCGVSHCFDQLFRLFFLALVLSQLITWYVARAAAAWLLTPFILNHKVCYEPRRPIRPVLVSGYCSM